MCIINECTCVMKKRKGDKEREPWRMTSNYDFHDFFFSHCVRSFYRKIFIVTIHFISLASFSTSFSFAPFPLSCVNDRPYCVAAIFRIHNNGKIIFVCFESYLTIHSTVDSRKRMIKKKENSERILWYITVSLVECGYFK